VFRNEFLSWKVLRDSKRLGTAARGCVVAKELPSSQQQSNKPEKIRNPKRSTSDTDEEWENDNPNRSRQGQTSAALVKAHLPQQREQPITDTTKKVTVSTLHTADMTVNQQLQLILEKLDKQENVHKTLFSGLDKLEKATLLRRS
jgi:hypothetical protein